MSSFKAAALQLNSQPSLEVNLSNAYNAIRRAVEQDAVFIGLPENFAFLGDDLEKQRRAGDINAAVMESIPQWAKEFGVHLLAGGFPVPASNETPAKSYNRSILVGPDGTILQQYDKIHLFDISLSRPESYKESETVKPGALGGVVAEATIRGVEQKVRIGLSICYDIRFPELYRLQSSQGADILTIPAAFTRPTGKAHWEILLRARAIENSCYVIAPAQTGTHGLSRKTYGRSMIIDPWGRILSDAGEKPGMALAEINLDDIKDIRQKLPALSHRKL
ncbi:carbon-nitrogen hydrolase family protein [Balneolaceae bacterium ANBcel3]|nr:carbon-nitrogen hydrolase family protein [Balneolaceae bacterium ANBcel3]